MAELIPPSSELVTAVEGHSLTDILPKQVLADFLRDIYEVTKVRASLNACSGENISLDNNENAFCLSMRDKPEYHYCHECSRLGGERALKNKAPYMYRCHMGFMATAIPVMVEDHLLGALIFSGYMTDPVRMRTVEQLLPAVTGRVATQDELLQAPFIAYQRAQDIATLLGMCANFIAEAYQRNLAQQQLHEKSMQLLAQANARAETERLLGEAEFKMLQSQINPHFLFNILNAISQMSLLEGGVKTPAAIYSLSSLLRRCLRKEDGVPPLREELDYIREYLNIKKLMYRDRIRWELDIDPDCNELRVPLFTLQPLVENALLHGLEPKEEGGTLWLTVRQEGAFVVICVRDDGMGCSASTLKQLRACQLTSTQRDLTGLGLSNVIMRLTRFFGKKFRWEIESAPKQGTKITLWLPKEEKKPG